MKKKAAIFTIASTITAISTSTAIAATTPYDLIRPTWPLSWDSTAISKFDTTVTKKIGVLDIPNTPATFKAGELMPDALDQAYLDAINSKISPIRVNQAGYLKSDKVRQFYYVGTATEFEVVNAAGKSLSTKITGTFTASNTETASKWTIVAGTDATTGEQKRYQVNFTGPSGIIQIGNIPQSAPTNERLRIKVGDQVSSTFIISDDVYTMAKDATLKFFGIQRSGNSESWFHGPSHLKDGAGKVVKGDKEVTGITVKAGDLQGGWYDCGDHLKESQTQAFAFMALAVMSATNPTKDVDHYAYNQAEFVNTDKVPDVLREAKHGADFFLNAYRVAKGVIDDMPVSVGNMGKDHAFWNRPEAQDLVSTTGRGGPEERDVRLGELGATVSAEIAAGLAILSKNYAKYDSTFADSCLTVAEKMYDFAKAIAQDKSKYDGDKTIQHNTKLVNSPAYSGATHFEDKLATASVALLYATGKKEYADDMIRTKDLYVNQVYTKNCAGCFEGGWFMTLDKGMLKNAVNTSWANSHTYALYALYKLILADKTKATTEYGLTEEERLAAIEDCLADMIANLGDISTPSNSSITLPENSLGWKPHTISYDPTWYTMGTEQEWVYNRHQMGNIFEVLAYADVAADIEKQGLKLPNMASTGLMSNEMLQLGINQLNYMFGVNPWDISFVYGVGDKNDAHPHHRAANPEGRNTPITYKYNCPVGALFGGVQPDTANAINSEIMSWENYEISETCLDASTVLLSALTIVSNGGNDYYEKKCDNCTKEVTPFDGAYAAAYLYTWESIDAISFQVVNPSLDKLDSVVTYFYFEATEEEVDSCGIIFTSDICSYYNTAGFSQRCTDDLMNSFNDIKIEKVDDSYNKDKKTYSWAVPLNIGSLDAGTKLQFSLLTEKGRRSDGKCHTFTEPTKIKISDAWSFTSHKDDKDAPAYKGAPAWEKNWGDIQEPPKDPYIVIRSKGKLLWGYGPKKTTSDRVGIVQVAQKPNAQMRLNRGTLFVQTAAQGTKTLKVFDVLGNQLLAQNFNGGQSQVNLADFSRRGTLVVKLVTGNKLLATRTIRIK